MSLFIKCHGVLASSRSIFCLDHTRYIIKTPPPPPCFPPFHDAYFYPLHPLRCITPSINPTWGIYLPISLGVVSTPSKPQQLLVFIQPPTLMQKMSKSRDTERKLDIFFNIFPSRGLYIGRAIYSLLVDIFLWCMISLFKLH